MQKKSSIDVQVFFFSSRRRHTRYIGDWSSDVCSSDLAAAGIALAVKMDVADAEQVKAGFKQVIEKFGRLDILVNNAAITRDGLSMRMKADEDRKSVV